MITNIRTVAATAAAAAVLATPLTPATAQATHSGVPPWERALFLRSRALDQRYHLGSFRPIARGLHLSRADRDAGWLRALQLRSQGLDRVHHLGSFRRPPVM